MAKTPQKQFSRTIENFTCHHCGAEIVGNGYTNHCPHCLHSKHVDINPGDRASDCLGDMTPIRVEKRRGDWYVLQGCIECGHERWNKVCPEDDMDVVIGLTVAE